MKVEQTSIFDFISNTKDYKINKHIRLIELFGGIGSQAKALENLGVDFEHYKLVEFDKYAVASYNAIHHTSFTTQDITKINAKDLEIVDTNKYEYIMTYSFPCQDLSVAGKQAGMGKGKSTRSGLLWEVERLLNECEELPQILLMENVSQVHNKKNIEDFHKWQNFLTSKGYSNYWQDLNSKDYGVPQNRERCFMISILGDHEYQFPKPFELKLRLKDMLEEKVDEKYFLSERMIKGMEQTAFNSYKLENKLIGKNDIARCILARFDGNPQCISDVPNNVLMLPENTKKGYTIAKDGDGVYFNRPHQKRGVVQKETVPAIKTHNNDVGVVVDLKHQFCSKTTQDGNVEEYDIINRSDSQSRIVKNSNPHVIGGIGEKKSNGGSQYYQQNRIYSGDGIAMCHPANIPGGSYKYQFGLHIRKLTPKECWRLMGFSDIDFENAEKVNSNTQLYKQAGNSIVVNVLMEIFKKLF